MPPDILRSKYSPGVFFVRDQEWKVGERYELLHLLGSGSFSSVCCALDRLTGQKVALKRIPDVLSSPELARRVLREICILRRLRHPFVIELLDAFLTPSATGQYKLVGGELRPTSLDCYLSMELGEDGDLFALRGQIAAEEVRLLMWQLLHALRYLHTVDVWHRDVKSSNVLLMRAPGHRLVKLADFGSARSATQGGYHWAEQGAPEPRFGGQRMPPSRRVIQEQQAQHKRGEVPGGGAGGAMEVGEGAGGGGGGGAQPEDLLVQLGSEREAGCNGGVGFRSPLTRVVATPCYRAPEVVMSRGGYTCAIDMWSLGCIFGELLQRTPRVGSASTPHLSVAPLFAIHAGPLRTPQLGERWAACCGAAPGDPTTRSELAALFDVIGTPSWAEAEDVRAREWREYLRRLPGSAPTLVRRFAFAGEVAVHLLSRLLAFDPERRCTAEEALQHEYFAGLETDALPADEAARAEAGAAAGRADGGGGGSPDAGPALRGLKSQVSAAWEAQAAKRARPEGAPADGPAAEGGLQRVAAARGAAQALALLESEMVGGGGPAECLDRVRLLLERECGAQALQTPSPHARSLSGEQQQRWASPRRDNPLAAWAAAPAPKPGDGLLVDQSQAPDPARFGQERLSNTADTWAASLDTAAHLRPGRHGEWTVASGAGPAAGPRWGVSMTPPGSEGLDPRLQDVVRSQQLR